VGVDDDQVARRAGDAANAVVQVVEQRLQKRDVLPDLAID